LAARASASRPLKLRLLYLFAASKPPARAMDVSSALIARPCPGLAGADSSSPARDLACDEFAGPAVGAAVKERWVGVEAPVGMLVDESVLPAPRL
jgi:hypothetical protein